MHFWLNTIEFNNTNEYKLNKYQNSWCLQNPHNIDFPTTLDDLHFSFPMQLKFTILLNYKLFNEWILPFVDYVFKIHGKPLKYIGIDNKYIRNVDDMKLFVSHMY